MLLIALHSLGRLSTAFVSAVAKFAHTILLSASLRSSCVPSTLNSAGLSIGLDLYTSPNSVEAPYLLDRLRHFLSEFKVLKSPLLHRARVILERLRILAEATRDTVQVPLPAASPAVYAPVGIACSSQGDLN